MFSKVTLLLVVLAVIGCQARLPPKQPQPQQPSEESKEAQPSESAPVNPNESSGSESEEGDGSSAPFFPRSNEQEQFDKMLRETLSMFDALRSNLWHSRIHSFHHHGFPSSVPSMEDDPTAANPFTLVMRPPLFIRDPAFSFFNQQPVFNPFPRRHNLMPMIPNFQNQVPAGYNKVNETRMMVDGKEICQSVYEKVQQKGGNYFESRIITAQPCEQVNPKRDNESGEGNKKGQDIDSVKPNVERETDPKEQTNSDLAPVSTEAPATFQTSSPTSSSSSAVPEPQPDKPETEKEDKEVPDVKPEEPNKKPNNENEISDKASEPSISVSEK